MSFNPEIAATNSLAVSSRLPFRESVRLGRCPAIQTILDVIIV